MILDIAVEVGDTVSLYLKNGSLYKGILTNLRDDDITVTINDVEYTFLFYRIEHLKRWEK